MGTEYCSTLHAFEHVTPSDMSDFVQPLFPSTPNMSFKAGRRESFPCVSALQASLLRVLSSPSSFLHTSASSLSMLYWKCSVFSRLHKTVGSLRKGWSVCTQLSVHPWEFMLLSFPFYLTAQTFSCAENIYENMNYVIESLRFLGCEDSSMKGINILHPYFVTPTIPA